MVWRVEGLGLEKRKASSLQAIGRFWTKRKECQVSPTFPNCNPSATFLEVRSVERPPSFQQQVSCVRHCKRFAANRKYDGCLCEASRLALCRSLLLGTPKACPVPERSEYPSEASGSWADGGGTTPSVRLPSTRFRRFSEASARKTVISTWRGGGVGDGGCARGPMWGPLWVQIKINKNPAEKR